jgi:beta-phosphoglucomutase family hydrolase
MKTNLPNLKDPSSFSHFSALIFDCDGTLVDTMPTHYNSWVETLAKYEIPFSYDLFYNWAGVPTKDIVERLAIQHRKELDSEAVSQEKDQHFHKNLESLKCIEHVIAIAETYRGKKKMAVASGSKRWSVIELLNATGIIDWFDAISTAEDVKNPKPAPDVFLDAANKLGVKPEKCCVFEDAILGIQGAIAAGMGAVNILEE